MASFIHLTVDAGHCLGYLFFYRLRGSLSTVAQETTVEVARPLKALVCKSHNVTVVTLYWSKQVQRQAQIQETWKYILCLDGGNDEITMQKNLNIIMKGICGHIL